ncbi:MAG: hypothetical protein A2504_03960 [Bdellovibrionales bacterium RIFOXYD12_FULL_39_22]|nr:MAG: hypothetical protein A2385_11710 [Bdellovibrionales bacterium RIFOXYB1_FULL_39_21]OFZ41730.1 MAG: hypothetical protein A2485_02020 [Bdellovibrionales bacterium RIFOXYC12_FULL_39_17]OFZ46130.1 MAG: hypothetical protein A2404_12385 [Bdellovibrionales bacterium RIFOXYC1_FULL_39_130]OFZ74957.1 MAG: hypothetical protein A2560_15425 [Bdellovibrionales bacterium RIFOXYD1_FULL_39_84]OFZ76430.1 MAG: hypothetical protein A2451_13660 [Bdellovibrionales bacterium RIFOXYC2_FULL_39_8]OFZ92810.1 MAG:
MKIASRYLAASFIPPFVTSVMFFVSFLLTFELFKIVRLVVRKDIDVILILKLMGHVAVTFIPLAAPLAAIFSAIYALNKLSEDSEIIAMRSFGFSKEKILTPFMIVGVAVAISVFALNQNLIPFSKREFRSGMIQLTSKGLLQDIKQEQFFTDVPKITLFAEKVEEGGEKLENVFIHSLGKTAKDEDKVIMANKGLVIKQKMDKWGASSMRLNLSNGNIVKVNKAKKRTEKIIFKEYNFPLFEGAYKVSIDTRNSMLTNDELWEKIKKKSMAKKVDKGGITKARLELYSRYNTPLLIVIFIFLGFSIGVKRGRGAKGNSTVFAFVSVALYYVLFFLGLSLSKDNVLSAGVSIFFPTALLLMIAIYFYRRLDWVS